MSLKEGILENFIANTDETGRFIVLSQRTGKRYFIEPVGDPHIKWGSINPGQTKLMNKKGTGKYRGSIDEDESLITEENGFINIRMLPPGTSPLKAVEFYDAQYPDCI